MNKYILKKAEHTLYTIKALDRKGEAMLRIHLNNSALTVLL